MGLLDAGGSGWCLRWSATASWVVYDGQHGRCALVSARGPGDGGEVLKGSRFPGCCSRQLGLPPHGKLRDNQLSRSERASTRPPELDRRPLSIATAERRRSSWTRPRRAQSMLQNPVTGGRFCSWFTGERRGLQHPLIFSGTHRKAFNDLQTPFRFFGSTYYLQAGNISDRVGREVPKIAIASRSPESPAATHFPASFNTASICLATYPCSTNRLQHPPG